MTDHAFISSTKAADILNVSLRTIHLWVEKGILQAWKTPGGHRKITLASVEKIQHQRTEAAEQNEKAPTIVIIEDDPAQKKLYKGFFKNLALPVDLHFADNGFSGLIAIGNYQPDLVITDLKMPNMDGFQLIEEIRKQPELKNLDIIIISSMDKEDILKHDCCRGYKFIPKPIDLERFASHMQKFLAHKSTPK